ncbi:PepSY domain-containing protein [Aureimonas sp. AU20]|uniref:PepSY domain-containing protein n=1 Tax=Aureimonas sp. AU20 TaxID=1349819 RepID=UPI00071F7B60|nr:hypothetical protein [Aureimonas sp. AU20]ALN71875.1 hypothetical protein M673_04055 [Aureimonas sp. AU20]
MTMVLSKRAFARAALLFFALTLSVHAHAQDGGDGDGGGGPNSESDSNESGKADEGAEDPDDGSPSEEDDEDAPSPPESSGLARTDASSRKQLQEFGRGADGALKAVQANRALPLNDIVNAARHLTHGDVIDARLKPVTGGLQYELKVLEESGAVRRYVFDARSGRLLQVH